MGFLWITWHYFMDIVGFFYGKGDFLNGKRGDFYGQPGIFKWML